MKRFELFIAGRYLRARRKEAVISVITLISVLGVAAGVTALAAGHRALVERLGDVIGQALKASAAGATPSCA